MDSQNQDQAMTMAEIEDLAPSFGEILGADRDMPDRKDYLVFMTLALLAASGLILALGYIYLKPALDELYPIIGSKERICKLLEATGSWGPVVYILLIALEVVVVFWPFPLEMAGGFLFGLPLGILYSMAGLTLGAMIAFLLGRLLEARITRLIGVKKLKRFRRFMQQQGAVTAWVIVLIPGIPKEMLFYLMGLTRMSLKFFLVAVTLVRLPLVSLQILQGIEFFKGHQAANISLAIGNLTIAVLAYRYRKNLYKWLKQWYFENNATSRDKAAG
jgi:uncharacterized membrane protein YdjX (TVP38/TMEM64 family)